MNQIHASITRDRQGRQRGGRRPSRAATGARGKRGIRRRGKGWGRVRPGTGQWRQQATPVAGGEAPGRRCHGLHAAKTKNQEEERGEMGREEEKELGRAALGALRVGHEVKEES